ncbi:MAG: M20/M25/M40 family metallo-hydrolase [Desulfobacterales bacterium]
MITPQRMAETFIALVKIDSLSRREGRLAGELQKRLEALGAEIVFDRAHEQIGGECGNLIARFGGNRPGPPLLFNAHMDTVGPGEGIRPILADGLFTSDGTTILGADDKSAIAILLEALTVIVEDELPHRPLEVVLTVCEEVGLLGAKHLDFSLISARLGYALDATDTAGIVTRAPAANRLEFKIHGKDAHAGAAPEKGINAIWLASRAIATQTLGRIDHETTCNIGLIEGGLAINIVPSLVTVKGEVRSHNEQKLERVTATLVAGFEAAVAAYPKPDPQSPLPRLEVGCERDFSATCIPDDHPVVTLAQQAAANLGRELRSKPTGGGADANIFFQKGIMTGVLGTGMRDMHTVRENIRLDDMLRTAELVLEIIRLHAHG